MSEPPRDVHAHPAVIRHLGLKVWLLAIVTFVLIGAFVIYILGARGLFEPTQQLVLLVDNAEGVSPGMDMTFAGFPIGRVQRIQLAEDGKARVHIAVPKREAKWLREGSRVTFERSLVGGLKIRAYTGDLTKKMLVDGAQIEVLRGDTVEEIPEMVAVLGNILRNVQRMTDQQSELNASIAGLQAVMKRMSGKHGALEAALGSAEDAAKVIASIERMNALLASLQGVAARADGVLGKADRRVFGTGGVMDEAQKATVQLNALLADARESLKKADVVLANAQATSVNVRSATTDLAPLRAEIDATVRKLGSLIDEVNKKWPFERDTEVRLP